MKSGILSKGTSVSISSLVTKLKLIAFSLRNIGFLFLVLGLFGLMFIYLPLIYFQTRYFITHMPVVTAWNRLVAKTQQQIQERKANTPTWNVPDTSYSLYIPDIDAKSRVIPNVPVDNEKLYLKALTEGVAAAAGLSVPGQKGTVFLFAHSTSSPLNFARYNAVFYLLDRLQADDKIELVYKDKLYRYTVSYKQILANSDTSYLIPQDIEEKLVLQTCYPPGTTWKRLVVIAHRD